MVNSNSGYSHDIDNIIMVNRLRPGAHGDLKLHDGNNERCITTYKCTHGEN